MARGTVKWFNSAKGYGFICPTEGGKDVFAHFSAIDMKGYRSLKPGELVDFEVNEGAKGLHATNIRSLGDPNEACELENVEQCEEEAIMA